MPAKSESQRRLFAVAEHNPEKLYSKNKDLANLPHKTLHEFASTKGLYEHKKSTGGGGGSPVKFEKRENNNPKLRPLADCGGY